MAAQDRWALLSEGGEWGPSLESGQEATSTLRLGFDQKGVNM